MVWRSFVLGCGKLPVACRTIVGCGDGGWCRDPFVYGFGELPAADSPWWVTKKVSGTEIPLSLDLASFQLPVEL